jgi:hypothetical protein
MNADVCSRYLQRTGISLGSPFPKVALTQVFPEFPASPSGFISPKEIGNTLDYSVYPLRDIILSFSIDYTVSVIDCLFSGVYH